MKSELSNFDICNEINRSEGREFNEKHFITTSDIVQNNIDKELNVHSRYNLAINNQSMDMNHSYQKVILHTIQEESINYPNSTIRFENTIVNTSTFPHEFDFSKKESNVSQNQAKNSLEPLSRDSVCNNILFSRNEAKNSLEPISKQSEYTNNQKNPEQPKFKKLSYDTFSLINSCPPLDKEVVCKDFDKKN